MTAFFPLPISLFMLGAEHFRRAPTPLPPTFQPTRKIHSCREFQSYIRPLKNCGPEISPLWAMPAH
jgi:hypothetical protein